MNKTRKLSNLLIIIYVDLGRKTRARIKKNPIFCGKDGISIIYKTDSLFDILACLVQILQHSVVVFALHDLLQLSKLFLN